MLPPEINHSKTWKYAQAEWERRFLLEGLPTAMRQLPDKHIEDRYLLGSRLRLRKTIQEDQVQYKLTKKLALKEQEWISTIYLSEAEYTLLSQLPADRLEKIRHPFQPETGPTIGIDHLSLGGKEMWLAEVELTEQTYASYLFPLPHLREVSQDPAYSGREMARIFQSLLP
ncbi:MAG: hypothetical protein AAF399_16325 [Bacteroidota bacterium]